MRKNLTEIVFILDRSGSMSGLEQDTIGGFNSMINQQKNAEGHRFKSCRSHLCRRGGTGRRTGLKILRDLYSRIGSIPIAGIMRKQIRHRFFEVYAFFVI